jgi:hypothetical protein
LTSSKLACSRQRAGSMVPPTPLHMRLA